MLKYKEKLEGLLREATDHVDGRDSFMWLMQGVISGKIGRLYVPVPPVDSVAALLSDHRTMEAQREAKVAADAESHRKNAIESLLKAIELDEWNWTAWSELVTHELSAEDERRLPSGTLRSYFELERTIRKRCVTDDTWKLWDECNTQECKHSSLKGRHRALLLYHERRYSEALSVLQENVYNDDDCLIAASHVLFVQGDLAGLQGLALKAANERPSPIDWAVEILRGNLASASGDREAALVAYKAASRLQPSCSDTWVLIGHELVELASSQSSLNAASLGGTGRNHLDEAMRAYRRALQVDPCDARAWFSIGRLFELRDGGSGIEGERAIEAYRRAALRAPHDFRIWMVLGRALERLGVRSRGTSLPKALAAFQEAARVVPRDEPRQLRIAQMLTGRVLASLGRQQEAIDAFSKAVLNDQEEIAWDELDLDEDSELAANAVLHVGANFIRAGGSRRVERGREILCGLAMRSHGATSRRAKSILQNVQSSGFQEQDDIDNEDDDMALPSQSSQSEEEDPQHSMNPFF